MGDVPEGPPVVHLPERFDRRLRLGPFASARDALKFVTYAAVGAVAAPFTSPYLWLAIVATGFALSVYRPDGQALDEQGASFLRWKFRALYGSRAMNPPSTTPATRQGLLRVGSGQHIAIVRTGGTPIAYLPPVELGRRFERFRDLLRALRGGLAFTVTSAPMRPDPVVPAPLAPSRPDGPASAGYAELVTLLCRRRSVRRVDLVLPTETTGPDGISDLEVRVSTLLEHLSGLGLRAVRLRDRSLGDAARRGGWTWAR
jgi:hypothetical protein